MSRQISLAIEVTGKFLLGKELGGGFQPAAFSLLASAIEERPFRSGSIVRWDGEMICNGRP